jgi:hypothetical protein
MQITLFSIFENSPSLPVQDRILYFYPPKHIEKQAKEIGLFIALLDFYGTFNSSLNVITSKNSQTLILCLEEKYFLVLKVTGILNIESLKSNLIKTTKRFKFFYYSIELLKKRENFQFCLETFFMGQIERNFLTEDVKKRFDSIVYSPFSEEINRISVMSLVRIKSKIDYILRDCDKRSVTNNDSDDLSRNNTDSQNSKQGLSDLKKESLMNTSNSCSEPHDSGMNDNSASQVSYCNYFGNEHSCKLLLLYKDSLCCSWLDSVEDTAILYQYLVDPNTGQYDDLFINQQKPKEQSVISCSVFDAKKSQIMEFSGYIIGPTERELLENIEYEPKVVYLNDGTPHSILIYQYKSHYTLCVLIPYSGYKHCLFYQTIKTVVELGLFPIIEKTQSLDIKSIPPKYHYMTLNRISFRIKYSPKKPFSIMAMKIFNDICSKFDTETVNEELLSFGNLWIYGIKMDSRIILLVIEKEELGLDKVQGINIFIIDEINLFKASLSVAL